MASSGWQRWLLKGHGKKLKYVFQVLKIELSECRHGSKYLRCSWIQSASTDETQAEAVNATYLCKSKKVSKAFSTSFIRAGQHLSFRVDWKSALKAILDEKDVFGLFLTGYETPGKHWHQAACQGKWCKSLAAPSTNKKQSHCYQLFFSFQWCVSFSKDDHRLFSLWTVEIYPEDMWNTPSDMAG